MTANDELFGGSSTPAGAKEPTESGIEIPEWLHQADFDDNLEAPEVGAFAPRIYPGVYPTRLELTPAYDSQTRQPVPGGIGFIIKDGVKYPQIQYTVYIQPKTIDPDNFVGGERPNDEIAVPFNVASAFVTKLGISRIGELVRTFGLPKPKSVGEAIALLQQAQAAKTTGLVELGWRVFDKSVGREITTHPNPKRKDKDGQPAPDIPWPLEEVRGKRRPALMVTFSDGQQSYGRETVVRLLKPRTGKEVS